MVNYQAKLREVVNYINSNLIAEIPSDIFNHGTSVTNQLNDLVSGKTTPHIVPVTTTMLLLNSCLGNNTLMEGGSGTGKTKLASVVGSLLYQLPFEFLERKRIAGIPGVSVNEIYATHDLAELARGNDIAYLYLSFFAPYVIIDELNRFSELEQNRIREGIATGVWTYAGNHSFNMGEQVVISAINPEAYGGTFPLNENLLDNYPVYLEPARYNVIAHADLVRGAERKIKQDLGLASVVDELLAFYKEHKNDFPLIKGQIEKMQKATLEEYTKRGIPFLANGFMKEIQTQIQAVKLTPEANLFLYSLLAEMTYSKKFGGLRCEDPLSDHDHDKPYLSAILREGVAGRLLKDCTDISKALAWYFGKSQADVDEIRTAFVYTAPHRLKPETKFFQNVQNNARTLPIKREIARRVVEKAWENYSDFRGKTKDGKGIEETPAFNEVRRAIKMITCGKPEELGDAITLLRAADHPLAQSVLEALAVGLLRKK